MAFQAEDQVRGHGAFRRPALPDPGQGIFVFGRVSFRLRDNKLRENRARGDLLRTFLSRTEGRLRVCCFRARRRNSRQQSKVGGWATHVGGGIFEEFGRQWQVPKLRRLGRKLDLGERAGRRRCKKPGRSRGRTVAQQHSQKAHPRIYRWKDVTPLCSFKYKALLPVKHRHPNASLSTPSPS